MSNESFHFAFACDENFIVQFQVAVLSLIKSSVGETSFQCIHVLDCGIRDATWEKVTLRINTYAEKNFVRCEVFRHAIDLSLFEKYKAWNSSKAAYARLLLPNLLPNIRYCVYSDCDMLFLNNPWDLVRQLQCANVSILGHRNSIDRGLTNPDECWFDEKKELYNHDTYFCSGLIAMDLEKFRVTKASDEMFKFLARHPDVPTAEQPALNWFFRDNSALEDGGWGLFPIECFGDNYEIHAIHYSGGTPWKTCDSWYKYLMMKQQDDLWINYAEKMLGTDVKNRKILFSARTMGCLAFWVSYLFLKMRLPLPRKKEYLLLFSDMLYRHAAFDRAKRKLIME